MTNLLFNGNFSEGWSTDPLTGNQTPKGWHTENAAIGDELHYHLDVDMRPYPGDTHNIVSVIPEHVHKLNTNASLPPSQQLGGEDALILSCKTGLSACGVYKVFSAGGAFGHHMWQRVEIPEPGLYRLSGNVRVHAHGNGDTGAAWVTPTVDYQPIGWLTFKRDFQEQEYLHFESEYLFMFREYTYGIILESHTVGGIDFFVDDFKVEFIKAVDDTPPDPDPTECRGLPRVDYERTYNVIHKSASLDAILDIVELTYPQRQTVGFSTDDAGIGDLNVKNAVLWQWPGDQRQVMRDWYAEHYPGTTVTFKTLGGGEPTPDPEPEPEPEPDPNWKPKRYIPRGTVGGFHGAQGDDGQINIARALRDAGVDMPTAKMVVRTGAATELKQLHPNIKIIGRIIDLPGMGNLEWFNAEYDPIAQAQNRMNALRGVMFENPDVDYWEIINEQNQVNATNHRKRCQFFIEAIRIAESWGKRLACLSDSVGTPDYPMWEVIANSGLFERMAAGGHALSLHEYGRIGEWDVVGRFAYLYDNYILPMRLDIPLFITEYGVARGDVDNHQFVWEQFVQYERLCSLYPYFAGFHAYIGPNGDPQYKNAYSGIQDDFIEYAKQVRGRVNG